MARRVFFILGIVILFAKTGFSTEDYKHNIKLLLPNIDIPVMTFGESSILSTHPKFKLCAGMVITGPDTNFWLNYNNHRGAQWHMPYGLIWIEKKGNPCGNWVKFNKRRVIGFELKSDEDDDTRELMVLQRGFSLLMNSSKTTFGGLSNSSEESVFGFLRTLNDDQRYDCIGNRKAKACENIYIEQLCSGDFAAKCQLKVEERYGLPSFYIKGDHSEVDINLEIDIPRAGAVTLTQNIYHSSSLTFTSKDKESFLYEMTDLNYAPWLYEANVYYASIPLTKSYARKAGKILMASYSHQNEIETHFLRVFDRYKQATVIFKTKELLEDQSLDQKKEVYDYLSSQVTLGTGVKIGVADSIWGGPWNFKIKWENKKEQNHKKPTHLPNTEEYFRLKVYDLCLERSDVKSVITKLTNSSHFDLYSMYIHKAEDELIDEIVKSGEEDDRGNIGCGNIWDVYLTSTNGNSQDVESFIKKNVAGIVTSGVIDYADGGFRRSTGEGFILTKMTQDENRVVYNQPCKCRISEGFD